MNETKGNIILIITMFLIGMCVTGGTYAYWTWNSTVSKNVVFNTAGLSDSVVYKEGSSHFVGDFQPSSNFCGGLSTTISFYKKSEASNAPIVAGINMDINRVEHSIANSNSVYWVLTSGGSGLSTTSSVCTAGLNSSIVLAYGSFKDYRDNTTISLLSNIDVPLLESDGTYTIWIWINSNGSDLGSLSGMTLDTNIWSQIDVIDEEDYAKKAVVYNLLGGTGAPLIQYKGDGETVSISSIEPVRVGYMFNGWNTKSDGTGTSYSAGTTYSTNADLTLYAVWSRVSELSAYIDSLYEKATYTTYVNNNITYYADTANKLMNDGFGSGGTTSVTSGNVRYYDEEPNNYVYFNCNNYSLPSSSTCEVWRIIGVFTMSGERRVKIIRSTALKSLTFDNRNHSEGKVGDYRWPRSRLMIMLNPDEYTNGVSSYYSSSYVRGSYWKNVDSRCYYGDSSVSSAQDKTIACNYATDNTGLRNDATRNMIAESVWKIGTSNSFDSEDAMRKIFANQAYNQERGQGFTADEWTGKVGIPYTSDYAYAYNFGVCSSNIRQATSSACEFGNWMNNNGTDFWTMSRVANTIRYGAYEPTTPYTYMTYTSTYFNHSVYPTVYLKANVQMTGGDGSLSTPYTVALS